FLFEQYRDGILAGLRANPDQLLLQGLTVLTPLPEDLPGLPTLNLIRELAERKSWTFSELEAYGNHLGLTDIWRLQLDPLVEKEFAIIEGSSYRLTDGVYEFV